MACRSNAISEPDSADFVCGYALLAAAGGHRNPAESCAQVVQPARKREHGHDLGRGNDVEPCLAQRSVGCPAKAGDDAAERAVFDVNHAPPGDVGRLHAGDDPAVDDVLGERAEEVVRGGDGVSIAGEVDVDLILRYDARSASARSASLDAEYRAERRLAEGGDGVLADLPQPLCQADARGRLPFAGGRGVHARNDDEFALLFRAQRIERHLRLAVPEGDEVLGCDAEAARDLAYGA